MCVCRLESHRRSSGCMHPGRRVLRTAQLCRFVGTTSTGHTRRTAVPLPTRPNGTHTHTEPWYSFLLLPRCTRADGRTDGVGRSKFSSGSTFLAFDEPKSIYQLGCVYGCGPLYCPGGVYLLLDVIAAHVCISVQLYNSYSLLQQLP
jgi:hypothetical protein